MLLPRSQPAFAVPIADMPILCTLSILSEPGEQLVLLCTPLYFDQLSPQLRILLLCRLEHSCQSFKQGWFSAVGHHHLHEHRSRWTLAQEVLNFLDQLQHHILKTPFSVGLRA